MTRLKPEHGLLIVILLGYLVIGSLFAIQTPDWQAPDEPAHYNTVRQIAEGGCCPVIESGDWRDAYQNELKSARFHPDLLGELDTIQYEDHQPPLYYMLLAIPYQLSNGNLEVLRIVSVLIGALVVVGAYLTGRAVFPERPWLAVSAAGLVTFIPQHVAILASVNNDALAEAVVAFTLWLTVLYLRGGRVQAWHLGLIVGVGFLTKSTTYFIGGVVLVALMLRWWPEREQGYHPLLRNLALFLVPAVGLGALWWLRNFNVYGFPDFLGLAAHDAVVEGQMRTADLIASVGAGEYLNQLIQTTFQSFWGQFGWMAVAMDRRYYAVLLGVIFVAFAGGLLYLLRRTLRPTLNHPTTQRAIWIVLWLVVVLAFAQYFYYNSEFVQFQGRYLFPALVPMALLFALGLDAWRSLLLKRWAGTRWLTAIAFTPLALLDLYLITNVIVYWLSWETL